MWMTETYPGQHPMGDRPLPWKVPWRGPKWPQREYFPKGYRLEDLFCWMVFFCFPGSNQMSLLYPCPQLIRLSLEFVPSCEPLTFCAMENLRNSTDQTAGHLLVWFKEPTLPSRLLPSPRSPFLQLQTHSLDWAQAVVCFCRERFSPYPSLNPFKLGRDHSLLRNLHRQVGSINSCWVVLH